MKRSKIFILMALISLLTGCVKYDLKTEMYSDKSFSLILIDAVSKDYESQIDPTTSFEEYEKLGYKVESYSDNDFFGLKLIKEFDNIDKISSNKPIKVELTTLLDEDINNLVLFESKKTGTMTTYIADFTYNLEVEETDEEIDYSSYSEEMSFTYSMTIPDNATLLNDNSDSKTNNNKTLNWNIEYGSLKSIKFSFMIDDNDVSEKEEQKDNNNQTQQPNDNNDNNENEDIEDNISSNETNNTTDENNMKNNKNEISPGTLIIIIILIAISTGIVYIKTSTKKKNSKPTIEMAHQTSPYRKR